MGKYDHIMVKTADVQYKVMLAQLATANELNERNRLLRIGLAIKIVKLSPEEKMRVEAEIQEDLYLEESVD